VYNWWNRFVRILILLIDSHAAGDHPSIDAQFLDRYDTFYLTRAPGVQIPGGRPVFPEVPRIVPEDVLSQHGLSQGERQVLDAKSGLVVVAWGRT
jgi:hypothetical protein